MKKTIWQKIKSFFRKWMRANIISGKNGVTIGENAVVGACTLVNKDIPDNATAVGIPCRILEKTGVNS